MSTAPDPTPDRPTDDAYPGLPGWVKWTLLAVLAVVVVLAIAAVLVGGDHGPGRHMSTAPAATALLLGR